MNMISKTKDSLIQKLPKTTKQLKVHNKKKITDKKLAKPNRRPKQYYKSI